MSEISEKLGNDQINACHVYGDIIVYGVKKAQKHLSWKCYKNYHPK